MNTFSFKIEDYSEASCHTEKKKMMLKSFTSPIYDKVRIKPVNGMYRELWFESDKGHYQLTVRFAND